jgi:CspA family cold shock protein
MSSQRGKVKSYNREKGLGWITPDHGGKDVLVRINDLQSHGLRELVDGQHVEYDLQQGPKGPQATSIRVV